MIDFGSFIKDKSIDVDRGEVPGGNVALDGGVVLKLFILLGSLWVTILFLFLPILVLRLFWIEPALVTAFDDVKIAAMKTVEIFMRYFIVRSNFLHWFIINFFCVPVDLNLFQLQHLH